MRKTSLATLVTSALLSLNAGAADLLQAWRDALRNDSQLASAQASREASTEKSVQGRAGLLPSVSVGGEVKENDLSFSGFPSRRFTSNQYQIQLKQPLYNLAALEQYEQGKLQAAAGDVQLEQAKNELALRVAQAYFDVLAAQDSVDFLRAQKVAISEQLESAKRNFEVGTATITDTHEAQARFDLTEAQEIAALNDLEVKRHAFAQITGTLPPALASMKQSVRIAPPEPASLDAWVKNAESGNFGVVGQTLAVRIAGLAVSANRAGHQPTVDAVASYSASESFNPVFGGQFTQKVAAVGVQLAVPLFSGFSTTSRVREALSLEDKARADLDTARRNAVQGVRSAYLGMQSGLSQVRALEAAETSSKLALEANRLGYDVGVRINIDVLNAQQQLYSTRRDLAKARYETLLAGLKLKAAAGALGEADLAELNALLESR
jgi:outer membrane protein